MPTGMILWEIQQIRYFKSSLSQLKSLLEKTTSLEFEPKIYTALDSLAMKFLLKLLKNHNRLRLPIFKQ